MFEKLVSETQNLKTSQCIYEVQPCNKTDLSIFHPVTLHGLSQQHSHYVTCDKRKNMSLLTTNQERKLPVHCLLNDINLK